MDTQRCGFRCCLKVLGLDRILIDRRQARQSPGTHWGKSAYRVCRIACTQTVVMVMVCVASEDCTHLMVVAGSMVGGALIRTVL